MFDDLDVTQEKFENDKRLYKGDVNTVADLADTILHAIPVQPVNQKIGWQAALPPSFVVTRFQPTGYGTYYMHYYQPKTGQRTYRDVPKDFKLNVLTGTRGAELRAEWDAARTSKLATIGRRLTCTLGTDPEIFVVDDKGEIVPAWTYLPSKEAPHNYRFNNRGGATYWDGFQAEFTTNGHDTCLLWLSDNIQGGLKSVHQAAQKVGGKLTIDNVLPVNPDFLQMQEQKHVQFGCAPSYNVYGLRGNIQDGRDVPYRFAGGHLHFGLTMLTVKDPELRQKAIENYVRALDKILAVACVSLLGELDNPIRRQFYGQPGEYRMPTHGFEYRTLSNAWLCHPLAMNMVFDLARSVCGLADDNMLEGWQGSQEEAIEIVMNNDSIKARQVLARNKEMFKQICKVITGPNYYEPEHLELAYKVWYGGIGAVVKDPRDIVGNWDLEGRWICHGDGAGKNWYKAYSELAAGNKV